MSYRRIPWLDVGFALAIDGREEVVARCNRCGATARADVAGGCYVRIIAERLEHRGACDVPVALLRARFARLN